MRRIFVGLEALPELTPDTPLPAQWISPSVQAEPPVVVAYKLEFFLEAKSRFRFHLTADERYEFFVDGEQVAQGPERGDAEHWFFESYEINLEAGRHVFVARVWSLGEKAPHAQMSVRHGFLFFPQAGDLHPVLATGVAAWTAKILGGYEWRPPLCCARAVGWRQVIRGPRFDWKHESGGGEDWNPVFAGGYASGAEGIGHVSLQKTTANHHRLLPGFLPPMIDREWRAGRVRHVASFTARPVGLKPVREADRLAVEQVAWQALLNEARPLVIPPFTKRRIIIDLKAYLCARPRFTVSGGAGSRIEVDWSEGLFENIDRPNLGENLDATVWPKGNRSELEGKFFICPWSLEDGPGDDFYPDGGASRDFTTLWWQAGRFVQILIQTGGEELVWEDFHLRESRYPLEMEGSFSCSDESLNALTPLLVRGLQSCAHETYMDCPFYEQLMYAGDTRLEILTTYVMTRDDRLPRKALKCFDWSRLLSGLTQSHYPSRLRQIIPPFSLWWIGMAHDYALWRGEPSFTRSLLPGVRMICDYFANLIDRRDLLAAPDGWNFTDWVPEWKGIGVPPKADRESSGILNWQAVMALRMAQELEQWFGEPELAALQQRRAQRLADGTHRHFWNETRGLYADDLAHGAWSEHAQCLALLSGLVPRGCLPRLEEGLLAAKDLARTTIYFSHYLFEAYRQLGRIDALLLRMEGWKFLVKNGLTTPLEQPEPSRSDCHGWGAHPLFHFFATLAGIRPTAPGFSKVEVRPQLRSLSWLKVVLPHPRGEIQVSFGKDGLSVSLPDGVERVESHPGQLP